MKAARFVTWLMLGIAPLACAAQVRVDRSDLLKDSYFGVNVGMGKYRFRDPPTGFDTDFCSGGTLDCRDDPIGWKLTGGYMIWRFFGVEAVAYSMGDARVKVDFGGGNVLQQKVRIEG